MNTLCVSRKRAGKVLHVSHDIYFISEHFTQIVWKETTMIGVGVGHYGPKTVVVVTYFPRGNIPEQFKRNVSWIV